MRVFSCTYVIFLCGVYVNSNPVYTDRLNNDRSKAHYDVEDPPPGQQAVMIAEDPPLGPAAMPYAVPFFYQRMAAPAYMYGEYFRPRQRFLPAKQYYDSPAKRADYYYVGKMEEPERRQCRSLGRRRSVSYAKQPFKAASLKEDASSYYASDMNSASHSGRVERNDLYSGAGQYDEADENVEEGNQNERFADEKYPSVLANFKIGTKLDKKSIAESSRVSKREYRQNDTSVAKEKESGTERLTENDNDGKVAEELRDILDYMGLIDEDNFPNAKAAIEKGDESKKETFEDENMEEGNNKISLAKEDRRSTSKERSKREDKSSVCTESSVASSTASESERQKEKSSVSTKEPDRSKRESKRQEINVTTSRESNLAETEDNGGSDYEKRMERQIQNRINALKEEVKREIASLKAQEAAQAVHSLNDDSQRKKRQVVSTLVDEENSDLDPALHPEEALKPHVRKRRHVEHVKNSQESLYIRQISPENYTTSATTQVHPTENSSYSEINYPINYTNNYTTNIRINDTQNYTVNFDRVSSKSNQEGYTVNEKWSSAKYDSADNQNDFTRENSHNVNISGNYTLEKALSGNSNRKKREVVNDIHYIPSRFAPSYVALPEASMAYVPYNRNYEVDEAEGEMDYDRYFDVKPNAQERRKAGTYLVKRAAPCNQHLHRDVASETRSRRRRDQDSVVAFHGGGAAENHLSSIRARRMGSRPRVRRKAHLKRDVKSHRPQTLNDMSDTDLFGALPQGYNGELGRFKRVRRSRKKG